MTGRPRRAQRIDYAQLHATGERQVLSTEDGVSSRSNSESSGTELHEPQIDGSSEANPIHEQPTGGSSGSWEPQTREPLIDSSGNSSGISTEDCSGSEDCLEKTLVPTETGVEGLCGIFKQLSFLETEMENNIEMQKLLCHEDSLYDDIYDYIDENPTSDLLTVEDINAFTFKLEDLRSKYRNVHKEIKRFASEDEYADTYSKKLTSTLQKMKDELVEAKRLKNDLRNDEIDAVAASRHHQITKERNEIQRTENSVRFLIVEVDRLSQELFKDIDLAKVSTDRSVLSDEELTELKKQLPTIQSRMNHFAAKFNELLKLVPDQDGDRKTLMEQFGKRYIDMGHGFSAYQERLQTEVNSREISKEKKFQTSSLNIILPKFKGYDSSLDYYTFRSKFEKLHLQDVPERALPELLKNNYLEGPALEAVKRLQTTGEIWANLKKSFGDPRVLLQRKLAELESIGCLTKHYGRVNDIGSRSRNRREIVLW